MFLSVVRRPIPHKCFDRKMLIERVSEEVVVSKLTAHQNFSNNVLVNTAIKSGESIKLFDGSSPISSTEIVEGITIFYALEDTVRERLELSYTSYIGDMGNTKEEKLVAVAGIFKIKYWMDARKDLYMLIQLVTSYMFEEEEDILTN